MVVFERAKSEIERTVSKQAGGMSTALCRHQDFKNTVKVTSCSYGNKKSVKLF